MAIFSLFASVWIVKNDMTIVNKWESKLMYNWMRMNAHKSIMKWMIPESFNSFADGHIIVGTFCKIHSAGGDCWILMKNAYKC